jgi:hypothetical protein
LRIIQNSTGGWAITMPTYHTSGGIPLVFSTAPLAVDILSMYYDGANYHCQIMNDSKVVA